MLTSQVLCHPGLLVPPWGLLTPKNALTSYLDGEEGVGVHHASCIMCRASCIVVGSISKK
jgi:hypothetical protein